MFSPATQKVSRSAAVRDGCKEYVTLSKASSLCATGMGSETGMVLLPTAAAEYGSEEQLVKEVTEFIHQYVELPDGFETLATHYAMFTWLYDRFDEVPYLRMFSPNFGCGKSRALETVGAICYRPAFVAGSSTSAVLRRIVDTFRGTLVGDEQDFNSNSDLASSYVKMLNQGFQRGRPVLLCGSSLVDFEPQSFHVFGPKVLVTRQRFKDDALESRCLTVEMQQRMRDDIPTSLPRDEFDEKALALRNKLLKWRFDNYHTTSLNPKLAVPEIEDRLNQIGVPLLSTVSQESAQKDIANVLRRLQGYLIDERVHSHKGTIVACLRDFWANPGKVVLVGDVTKMLNQHKRESMGLDGGDHLPNPWNGKRVGIVLREELQLKTKRKRSGFIVVRDLGRLADLCKRYAPPSVESAQSSPAESAGS